MTKTYNLSIGERITALSILNSFKGNADEVAFAMDDAKALSISDETKTEIGLQVIMDKDGKPTNSLQWNNEIAMTKDTDIDLHSSTVDFIVNEFKKRDDSHELSVADGMLIALGKKLA